MILLFLWHGDSHLSTHCAQKVLTSSTSDDLCRGKSFEEGAQERAWAVFDSIFWSPARRMSPECPLSLAGAFLNNSIHNPQLHPPMLLTVPTMSYLHSQKAWVTNKHLVSPGRDWSNLWQPSNIAPRWCRDSGDQHKSDNGVQIIRCLESVAISPAAKPTTPWAQAAATKTYNGIEIPLQVRPDLLLSNYRIHSFIHSLWLEEDEAFRLAVPT